MANNKKGLLQDVLKKDLTEGKIVNESFRISLRFIYLNNIKLLADWLPIPESANQSP